MDAVGLGTKRAVKARASHYYLLSPPTTLDSLEMDGLEISLIKDLVHECFKQGFADGAQPL